MTTAAVTSVTSLRTTKSRIGLVVLGATAAGWLLGFLLVLIVLAGGPEYEITGAALLALGAGFVLLAVGSTRFSDQPQRWALPPGIAAAVVGATVWILSPGDHTLALAGWAWPRSLSFSSLGRSTAPAGPCTAGRAGHFSIRRSSC